MNGEQLERFERALREHGWRWEPSSYQIRNRDGSPGAWIAQAHIWHETPRDLTVQPLMETDVKLYDSKENADAIAAGLAFGWLLRNSDVTGPV
jgi:hypothetical protein